MEAATGRMGSERQVGQETLETAKGKATVNARSRREERNRRRAGRLAAANDRICGYRSTRPTTVSEKQVEGLSDQVHPCRKHHGTRPSLGRPSRHGFSTHELEVYRLEKGDLLLAEASGSASQVGKAAIWADQVPNCCFQNTVIRHRPHCREFAPFLLWLFRNFYVNGTFSRVAGGVGINHLSASRFAQIPLPICSPAEQAEIVGTLDEHLERADSLDAEIDANLTRAEALRQSILKQAFSGNLVAQDPNDEPAAALLERIKATKNPRPKRAKQRTAQGNAA